MENVIKEVRAGNKILRILQDNNPDDPRSWDNLAKMIFVGKHKSLGDKHDFEFEGGYNSRQDFIEKGENELRKYFKDVAVIKAIHLYEHSGTSISTSMSYPFDCKWDAGTIGFAVITKADIKENFSVKRVTKELLKRAEAILDGEVETLNQYISGDVYGFELVEVSECDKGCEHETYLDSCWGFFGNEFMTNGITDHFDDEELKNALKAA